MRGDVRSREHLLNVFMHDPATLLEPLERRLNVPPQRVNSQPTNVARKVLRLLTEETRLLVSALLALSDTFERGGDLLGEGNLETFVGGDLATALLALVLLLETGDGMDVRENSRGEVVGRKRTPPCTSPTSS